MSSLVVVVDFWTACGGLNRYRAGAIEQRRNRDINFPFRQDSDFYYLTGFFSGTDALLVLIPGRDQGEVIVFCRERDTTSERRDGRVLGPDACQLVLGVDDGFPVSDLGTKSSRACWRGVARYT